MSLRKQLGRKIKISSQSINCIIERSKGIEGKEPIHYTIPEYIKELSREGGAFDCDIIQRQQFARYEDVWPRRGQRD